MARVVSVNPDEKGIVRDVNVRTFPSYPVSVSKPAHKEITGKNIKIAKNPNKIPKIFAGT